MSEQNSRTVADAVDQNEEQLKQIKNEVGKKYNHQKLTINRVPDQTVETLKQLSYDKFAGDYGLTLAYLVEIHKLKQEFDSKLTTTNDKVIQLQEEIQGLKQEIIDEKNTDESKTDTLR